LVYLYSNDVSDKYSTTFFGIEEREDALEEICFVSGQYVHGLANYLRNERVK
jgi:hypothetical protein